MTDHRRAFMAWNLHLHVTYVTCVWQVTDHRRAFMAWNAMDMDAEALHHEQAATQERVEAILRASHPHAAQLPNG